MTSPGLSPRPAGRPATIPYEITVRGLLDDRWTDWFGDVVIQRSGGDGTTSITALIADQAQLQGLLTGLGDLNAGLLSLRMLEPRAPTLTQPLHTERLTLRPATTDDTDPTWAFRQLEPVNDWLTGCPADLDGYRALFSEPVRLASTVVVTLGRDQPGPIIGDFMLRREDARAQLDVAGRAGDQQAELGWVLDPAYTGQGYATEAVRELLRHCFQDLGVRRVTASCFLGDEASWRLMERVGMRRELHAVRESLHRSGRWLDTVGYAVLTEEWSPA